MAFCSLLYGDFSNKIHYIQAGGGWLHRGLPCQKYLIPGMGRFFDEPSDRIKRK